MKFRITQEPGETRRFKLYEWNGDKWRFVWTFNSVEAAKVDAAKLAGVAFPEQVIEEFVVERAFKQEVEK